MRMFFTPKKLAVTVLFLVAIGYAAYQLSGLFRQPVLIVLVPTDNSTVNSALLTLKLKRNDLITRILVDRNEVELTEKDTIETQLLLAEGYNIITIIGEDRFGRIINEKVHLVYKPAKTGTNILNAKTTKQENEGGR